MDNNNSLEVLARLIDKIVVNCMFSNNVSLLSGKMGIVVILYHYSKFTENKQVNDFANKYLDTIIENISIKNAKEATDIAWTITHLINFKFINADSDIFEDIDNRLFAINNNKKIPFVTLKEALSLGLYIHSRLMTSDINDSIFWQTQMKAHLQTVLKILNQRYIRDVIPIFECRDLYFLLSICVDLQKRCLFKEEIILIYGELPLFLELSLKEEYILANKFLLSKILDLTPIKINNLFLEKSFNSATLTDINQFFLNRFIFGLNVKVPEVINKMIQSIIYDTKRIDSLLSMLNPNNIGIDNYVSGLAWSILQWNIEKTNN